MDYSTLATLSNPGADPSKASGRYDSANPLAYALWLSKSRMHEESLKNAMPLAAQNAQMQQQKTQEYMAGAPGRMDEISLANMKAKAGVGNFNRDMALKNLEADLQDAEKRAKLADVTQDIAEDSDAYATGDERLKNQIIQKNTGRKLRNGYVVGTDPKTDDLLFTVAGKARAADPKLVNKEKVQGLKNEGGLQIADVKGQWAQKTAAERNETMLEVQRMKQSADAAKAAGKPPTPEQQLFESVKRMAGGDDAAMYAMWSQYKSSIQQAKIESEIEFLKKYNIKTPDSRPAQAPVIPGGGAPATAAPATTQPAKPKFEVGKVYTDKNGVKAKFTEKGWEIVKEGR